MKVRIIIIVFVLGASITYSQQNHNVLDGFSASTGLIINDSITNLLIHKSSGDRAHDYVSQIALLDRQQNTKGYKEAVLWVKEKAVSVGLDEVEIESYKSDGKTSYFGDTPQEFWIAKKGELWSYEPYKYKITSYADLPMSLATNSYSKKGKAKLIDIGTGQEDEDYENKDIKGNIVLTSNSPYRITRKAVWEKGAVGIISYRSIPYWDKTNRLEGDFVDQVGWSGMPVAEEKNKESFAFMISERKAKELKELLAKNKEITLYFDIETSHKPDTFGIVSGVIKGSKYPDEEIIITSHIDHYKPGANDNASGSAVSLEIARTLNELIKEKKIPQPLRTIRFLWLPEFTGTKAWFSRHEAENKKRIYNINLDMLGSNLKKSNSFFDISYTPDWNASYINAFSSSISDFLNLYNNSKYPKRKDFQIIPVNGSRNYINSKVEPYTRGSDHQIFNDFGIPGIAYSTWPDNYYHSSEDSPDKVDPTQLHRVTFTGLATIVMGAYADTNDAFDIINLVEMYGKKRLKDDEFSARKYLLNTGHKNLINQFYLSSKAIHYAYKREKEALKTCLLFSNKGMKSVLDEKIKIYDENEKQAIEELGILAKRIDKNIALKSHKLTPLEIEGSKLIPFRKKDKLLNSFYSTYGVVEREFHPKYTEIQDNLDKILSQLREREIGELRIYEFEDIIASYIDGKKSILDIRNALYAEYKIEIPIKLIKDIFDIFEKADVIYYKTDKP